MNQRLRMQKLAVMKLTKIWVMLALALQVGEFTATARDQEVDVKALLKRIEELEQKVKGLEGRTNSGVDPELEQKVKILERKNELAEDASTERAKTTPTVTIDSSGLQARSGDSNFVFSLHGILQVDNRTFFEDGKIEGNDGFLLRRARPIFSGTVYRDFDFLFVPDFGGSTVQIFDAYLNYRYSPWLQVRAGKAKSPVGLEQLQADPNTIFNERSLATELTPNRDVGFQLLGDVAGGVMSYAVGIFNGVGDNRNSANADFEDDKEFAGRIFLQPFRASKIPALEGLGFGIAGSFGNTFSNVTGLPATTGGTLAGYTTDGQQQFFAYNPTTGVVAANGDHWRLSPQGYYYYGPFGLMGEYVISHQQVSRSAAPVTSADLEHRAWEVTGSWLLTGENATYGTVTPRHPFDLHNGGWGAFQIVGRYAELDIDDNTFPLFANPLTSASAAKAWSVGLNWYLNKNMLFKASYSRTTFSGGGGIGTSAPAIITRQPEEVFFTRLQLAF
jgi:phosphate-selective porin OprO/OprP